MLSRKFRAGRNDVEEAARKGKSFPGAFLYAKYVPGKGKTPRFAAVVSKKIEKTSVGRHLLKRRIVSAIEKRLPSMGNFSGILVFFAASEAKRRPFSALSADVEAILRKAGAIA